MTYTEIFSIVGWIIDGIGVTAIAIGVVISTTYFIIEWVKSEQLEKAYQDLRHDLSRTIIIGLEFLVAGDIIRSIAGPATFQSVGVLAVIVLIRAFLSFQYEKGLGWQISFRKKHHEQ